MGAGCAQPFLWRLTSVTTIFPWVGLCPARKVLPWAFSSTDASAQVCTLPCSSHRVRVVDMLVLVHPLARACPVRPSNTVPTLADCTALGSSAVAFASAAVVASASPQGIDILVCGHRAAQCAMRREEQAHNRREGWWGKAWWGNRQRGARASTAEEGEDGGSDQQWPDVWHQCARCNGRTGQHGIKRPC